MGWGKGKGKYRWRGLGYGEGEGEAAFHFHFCTLRDSRVLFLGQTSKCTQRCLLRVISFNSMEGERQTDRQTWTERDRDRQTDRDRQRQRWLVL